MIDTIQRYKMPIIRLDRKNSREAICLVFEKVNVGGMKLDAFELLTAIYVASTFDLREDWHGGNGRLHRMIRKDNPRRILKHIKNTDFLQACTILHTRQRQLDKARLRASKKPTCRRLVADAKPFLAYR